MRQHSLFVCSRWLPYKTFVLSHLYVVSNLYGAIVSLKHNRVKNLHTALFHITTKFIVTTSVGKVLISSRCDVS